MASDSVYVIINGVYFTSFISLSLSTTYDLAKGDRRLLNHPFVEPDQSLYSKKKVSPEELTQTAIDKNQEKSIDVISSSLESGAP